GDEPPSVQVTCTVVFPVSSTLVHTTGLCLCGPPRFSPAGRIFFPTVPQHYPLLPNRILVLSSLTWSKITWRSAICCSLLSTAYMTVVWSRPPKASAMRG